MIQKAAITSKLQQFLSSATHGHLITSDTWVEHFNTICTQEAGIWTKQPSEVQMSGVRFFIQEKNQYLVFSLSLLTNDFLTSRIWFKPHAGKEVLHGVIAKIIRDRTKFKQISLQERKREEYQFCKCTYTTTRLIGINLNIAFYQRGCDLIGYRTRCL